MYISSVHVYEATPHLSLIKLWKLSLHPDVMGLGDEGLLVSLLIDIRVPPIPSVVRLYHVLVLDGLSVRVGSSLVDRLKPQPLGGDRVHALAPVVLPLGLGVGDGWCTHRHLGPQGPLAVIVFPHVEVGVVSGHLSVPGHSWGYVQLRNISVQAQ